ncbi:hypothetical protein HDU83_001924 [Entophlyctis luteolus]|nr:hypothetical protein HDU83_001924 [Entophlyctis luteolus]
MRGAETKVLPRSLQSRDRMLTPPSRHHQQHQQLRDADYVPVPSKQRNSQLPPATISATTSSAAAAAVALKRKRIPACDSCNQKKIKCDGLMDCSNCAKASIKCTFDRSLRDAKLALASVSSKRKRGDSSLRVETTSDSLAMVTGTSKLTTENPSQSAIDPKLQILLIEAYFEFVDPWIPVVNKSSFLENPEGQPSLLNAICALGALFSSSPSIIDLGKLEGGPFLTIDEARQRACEYFYMQANSSINQGAGEAQLSVVSASLLLKYLCSGLGRASASWLHMEAAIADLSALRNIQNLDDTDEMGKPIEKSSARPYADWIEGRSSVEITAEISERKTKQTLAFSSSNAFARIDVSESPLDHYILLSQIFGRILAFSKVHKPSPTNSNQMASKTEMQLNILETCLKSWHAFLPEHYRDRSLLAALPGQTQLFATSTLLQYNLCTILLHKPTLLAQLRSTPAQLHGTRIPALASFIACQAAARSVSELVATAEESGMLERLEPTVGSATIFHAALVRLISGQVMSSVATATDSSRAHVAEELDAASRLAHALQTLGRRWGCATKMWTSLVGVIAVARAEADSHQVMPARESDHDSKSAVLGSQHPPTDVLSAPAVGLGVNMANPALDNMHSFDIPVNGAGSNPTNNGIAATNSSDLKEEIDGMVQPAGSSAYNFGLLGGSVFGANDLFPNASDLHLWPGLADHMALLGNGTDFGQFGRDSQS